MGIDAIPVTNVENACAGASTALHLAYTGVRAGMVDVALAVGSEKITDPALRQSFLDNIAVNRKIVAEAERVLGI